MNLSKTLIIVGLLIALVGLLLPLLAKLGLGRLPGDIVFRKENATIHFPIVTMIVVSVAATVIINIIIRFFGK